jgi:hypothetical protein
MKYSGQLLSLRRRQLAVRSSASFANDDTTASRARGRDSVNIRSDARR